jgi:hypothetical protein
VKFVAITGEDQPVARMVFPGVDEQADGAIVEQRDRRRMNAR